MQTKLLGRTGLKVSALCFGTMSFGGEADQATAEQLFQRCREAGITVATADTGRAGGPHQSASQAAARSA